ncbi:very short patch repair endonuclease [Bdellovibrio sp. HCB-162]|uniref:very short patch repair endonuclease n=1 Tax=Bdellovibrio sp. HCB-162 TaxID=3394234 RepID=UPI0039BCE47B
MAKIRGRVSEKRSKNMQAVKSRNTKPELLLDRLLKKNGFKFRRHSLSLPGHPDFFSIKNKTVIFCDGDFWHGRFLKEMQNKKMVRKDFWLQKIGGNVVRDKKVTKELKDLGFVVIRVWASDILKRPEKVLRQIKLAMLVDE